jgi:hypothetical protein
VLNYKQKEMQHERKGKMPHYTKEWLEASRIRHEQFEKIIAEQRLENKAFYWIKDKHDPYEDIHPEWKLSQCSIYIETCGGPTMGRIFKIGFDTISSDWGRDYEDIILGPKIEIGEPPA